MELIWINASGQSLVLPAGDEYILQDWGGFAYPANVLQTKKSINQYGATVTNQIFNPRAMNIQFTVRANSKQELFDKRLFILNRFNPVDKVGLLKWVQEDGTEYHIAAYVDTVEFPGGNARGNNYQTVQVGFLAEDPRWYDPNKITHALGEGENLIVNEGTTETPFELILDGPIDNPVIRNESSREDFKINYNLALGEKIKIYSEFGNKRVIFINTAGEEYSAFSLLDLDSKLFYLMRGNNVINILADGITVDTQIILKYYNRFLGV